MSLKYENLTELKDTMILETPTVELKYIDGVLNQKWCIAEVTKEMLVNVSPDEYEWRPVPREDNEG